MMKLEDRERLEEFKLKGTLSQQEVRDYMELLKLEEVELKGVEKKEELEKKHDEHIGREDEPKKGMFGSKMGIGVKDEKGTVDRSKGTV